MRRRATLLQPGASACRIRWSIAIVACLGVLATIPSARAELPVETCRALMAERTGLERTGTRQHLENGPEWAQANLTPEQIQAVAALIGIDEKLQFDCPVGFDNAVVAAINGDDAAPPPLPDRAPDSLRLARRALAAQPTGDTGTGDGRTLPLPERNLYRTVPASTETPQNGSLPPLPKRPVAPGRAGLGEPLRGTIGSGVPQATPPKAVRGWRRHVFNPD